MKAKKWAKKARSITVPVEVPDAPGGRVVHVVEIRDAKRRLVRTRTLEYTDDSPALSAIMSDVQSRLARNALIVDPDSYELIADGRLLRARVWLAGRPRR